MAGASQLPLRLGRRAGRGAAPSEYRRNTDEIPQAVSRTVPRPLSLVFGPDPLEHGAQIDGALLADLVMAPVEPRRGGLAPDIAQAGQKRPFHIHLGRGPHRLERVLVLDQVDLDGAVVAGRELALFDQPVDEVDGAQFLEEAGVEADVVNPG